MERMSDQVKISIVTGLSLLIITFMPSNAVKTTGSLVLGIPIYVYLIYLGLRSIVINKFTDWRYWSAAVVLSTFFVIGFKKIF
jgi:hypothetical protein